MELRDVVPARRMARSYDPGVPVRADVVSALVEAVTHAPSAGAAQGCDVVVLRCVADRELFWGVTTDPGPDDRWLAGMRTAPLLLVVLADPGAYARRYAAPDKARAAGEGEPVVAWWDVDAGMAALLVLLTATDAGLGACFFGVPPGRHEALRAALGVPADRRVLGVVSVGTPAPHPHGPRPRSPHRPPRRRAADVGHDGRFGVPLR